jgi:hypothetical protein
MNQENRAQPLAEAHGISGSKPQASPRKNGDLGPSRWHIAALSGIEGAFSRRWIWLDGDGRRRSREEFP